MKNFLLLAAFFLAGFLLAHASAYSGPRMTLIGEEDVDNATSELHTKYLHDRETGQEVVCVTAFIHMDGQMSCYLTGRKW